MKALLLTAPSKLEFVDFPDPAPADDEVLLKVRACGICGSDIHGWDGSSGRRRPPLIMGHEAAHALREHAREQMGKSAATQIGAGLLSALLGLGGTGDALLNMGGQLLTLRFGRADESEADLIGIDLAARAGYDPAAGVTLWQKMAKASQGAPPEFISTHPSGPTRIADIEANLPKVQPLYARADKPDRRFGPPAAGQN